MWVLVCAGRVLAWTFRQLMFHGEFSRVMATGRVTWVMSGSVPQVERSASWAQISEVDAEKEI